MTQLNTQPIEKHDPDTGAAGYYVVSIFSTIQGEGPFSGRRATFVRLAGCNLQCPACDTDYTSHRTKYTAAEIRSDATRRPADLVVITGGEPFRQNIVPLIDTLADAGLIVQVETNGTLGPKSPDDRLRLETLVDDGLCHIVVSPKTGTVHAFIASQAAAYKYVLSAEEFYNSLDGLPGQALGHPASPRLARPPSRLSSAVYIQPEDSKDPERNTENLQAAVDSCLIHGHILCLQTHKIANVE